MTEVEVREHIAAPAEQVWRLVGDPTRMGDLSPECQKVEWLPGDDAARPGARFRGHNRVGWMRWRTVSTVVLAEPHRMLVWDVDVLGRPNARWGFWIEPDGDECTLIQRFIDRRGAVFRFVGRVRARDVAEHNLRGMQHTVGRVKAVAEAG